MSTIYNFIQEQESSFGNEIPLETGWYWNFKDHIRRSFLYKNSQFEKSNEKRDTRPFKNIIRPILNIHYRTEGFDVKDVEIYVDDPDNYYKSFLIKKFHEKWARKNGMDSFIDELVESFVDYGGVLVKNVKGVRPEVVDLRTIAFCDQTDILSSPFAIKHYLSPAQLRGMASAGWGTVGADISIDDLLMFAENRKQQNKEVGVADTPGKYVEVYEVHNISEMDWDYTSTDDKQMMYICSNYVDNEGHSHGVTLFSAPEPKKQFKFLKRDPIQGRALGFGAIEELFEAQVWTNFTEIQIMEMLEQASKVFYKTTDRKFKDQNLRMRKSGSVFDLQPNTDIAQIDNQPRNLAAFENKSDKWDDHARVMGAASDLFLGEQPSSGTPFKSVETQLVEGKSLHIWRQGIIATFVDEIYRDWLIPQFAREITSGSKFLAELSADEMVYVSRNISKNYANQKVKDKILKGEIPTADEYNLLLQASEQNFVDGGNKRFMEIFKSEFSNAKLDVATNIAGKQKNLSLLTDKLVNYVRQLIAAPDLRNDPEIIKHVNQILEYSGMSPIQYSPRNLPQAQEGSPTGPLKDLAKANEQNSTGRAPAAA